VAKILNPAATPPHPNLLPASGEKEFTAAPHGREFSRYVTLRWPHKRPSKDVVEAPGPLILRGSRLRRSHLRMTKFCVSVMLTSVTVSVTMPHSTHLGHLPAGV
jgi:hypothetical protein